MIRGGFFRNYGRRVAGVLEELFISLVMEMVFSDFKVIVGGLERVGGLFVSCVRGGGRIFDFRV